MDETNNTVNLQHTNLPLHEVTLQKLEALYEGSPAAITIAEMREFIMEVTEELKAAHTKNGEWPASEGGVLNEYLRLKKLANS